jgi:hypothetical protein
MRSDGLVDDSFLIEVARYHDPDTPTPVHHRRWEITELGHTTLSAALDGK